MISPEEMRARWWLVPVLHGTAPWLLFAAEGLLAERSLALDSWELPYLGWAALACSVAGLLHAVALTRCRVRLPLSFSLLLGALAPFVAAGAVVLVLGLRSLVFGQGAFEPLRLLFLPLAAAWYIPIESGIFVLWLGVGSWLLLRPVPRAAAKRPA